MIYTPKLGFGWFWRTVLLTALGSCAASNPTDVAHWNTYNNPRYQFEFPYPANWSVAPAPDNGDGQVFYDPKNAGVEIRGWAGYQLPGSMSPKPSANFTTQQGISGSLNVEIGAETSSVTLALVQGEIAYHWQGRSPSQQFAQYYPLFYKIASQYRVPKSLR